MKIVPRLLLGACLAASIAQALASALADAVVYVNGEAPEKFDQKLYSGVAAPQLFDKPGTNGKARIALPAALRLSMKPPALDAPGS